MLYDLEVYSILKGSLPNATHSIIFKFSTESSGLGVGIGNRGIFFLKPVGDGTYTNADPNYYSVVAAANANRVKQDDVSPLTNISRELANVLATPPEAIVAERRDLQSKVGTSVEISEESGFFHAIDGRAPRTIRIPVAVGTAAGDVYASAVMALHLMPSAVTGPTLRDALSGKVGVWNRLWLVAALTDSGDLSGLQGVTTVVRTPDKKLFFAVYAVGDSLRNATSSHPQSLTPDLVPVLTEFLSSTDPGIRRAAAGALRAMPGKAAVKPLAGIALQDKDMEVRFMAETGLCRIAHEFGPPCNMPFARPNEMSTEATYRNYWSDWAAANLTKSDGRPNPPIP
jgi:hypothetical protein